MRKVGLLLTTWGGLTAAITGGALFLFVVLPMIDALREGADRSVLIVLLPMLFWGSLAFCGALATTAWGWSLRGGDTRPADPPSVIFEAPVPENVEGDAHKRYRSRRSRAGRRRLTPIEIAAFIASLAVVVASGYVAYQAWRRF